ncbi:FecR domain-containing protein [Rapidithrix thailandica]|uniref:FecR domain-containing protein n=1 Tax=Rapidithrix thailandica TaxID=413964 RepID=A0AAW9RS37_9BACT
MDYSNYSVEDFLMDESFQKYVREGDKESQKIWEEILRNFPDKAPEIEEAKEILQWVRFQKRKPSIKDAEQDIKRFEKYLLQATIGKSGKVVPLWKRGWAAAVVVMVCAVGFLYYYPQVITVKKTDTVQNTKEYFERKVPDGQKLSLKLGDGTTVKINAGSSIKFPQKFTLDKREVYLEGEAYFEVVKDAGRPFIIHTGNFQTTVLGTSFNINAYPSQEVFKIALVEGKVQVEDIKEKSRRVQLTPNQMAICLDTGIVASAFDPEEELAWKNDILVFKEADIHQVAHKLERWYGVDITLSKTHLIEKKFTGRFHNQTLGHILKGASFALGFDYTQQGKSIIITGTK